MKMTEKTGLVVEGGGMRGIYAAGVLDVLMDNAIAFDGIIGVSAGAMHGCSYISGQRGRSIRYYKKYCNDKRFMSWRNVLLTGDMVGEKFCYHELPEILDPYDYEKFNASKTEFYVGCSNVETGKPEYFRMTDMKKQIDLMRASASLPYVSRIVCAEGKKLLDGGCTDSIPVKAFMDMGFKRNVVVLTRHKGYQKKPEKAGLAKLYYRKYPEFVKALQSRPEAYNQTLKEIEKLEKEGSAFVFRPSVPLTIARMSNNPEDIQKVYDIGFQDAKERLPEFMEWFRKE